jgi:hypothetical protein
MSNGHGERRVGSGYINTDASQLVTPSLTIGERRTFVVTATVNSCTNLTNTARASWSIGNDEATALSPTPFRYHRHRLLLEEPNVSLTRTRLLCLL